MFERPHKNSSSPTYTFDGHNYASWASSFEDFVITYRLPHHLTESSLAKTTPDYDTWNQLDSALRSWMYQSILPTIAQLLSLFKPASALWRTLEAMYTNKTNISCVVEIFESKVINSFKITLVASNHLSKSCLSINHSKYIYANWNDIVWSSSLESISAAYDHLLLPRFVVKHFQVPKFQIWHQFFPQLFELALESL